MNRRDTAGAMSQENVEIVQPIYDALNRRDWETVFCDTHPDFEMTTQRGPNAGTHRRREAVQALIEDTIAVFDNLILEPEEFRENGDQVVALVTTRARPKGGSVDIVVRNGHLWTVRDGTILSLKTFPAPGNALEAAGLSEQKMSQENVEIVRRAFNAWSRGDTTALIQDLDPDVVLHVDQAGQGAYRGHEGVIRSIVDWTEDFDDFKVIPEEFLDNGDYVVVRTRQTGRGKSSGVPMEGLFWFVYELREGRAVRVDVVVTEQEALEAAGIVEGQAVSEEHVDLVREMQDAWNRGETVVDADAWHPDVEFLPLRSATEGAYHGLSGVEAFVRDTLEVFERFEMNYESRTSATGCSPRMGGHPRASEGKWSGNRHHDGRPLRLSRREDRALAGLRLEREGPRSRRAVGVA